MAAFRHRHLGFSKVGNFNCPYPSEGQSASSCQISQRSFEPFRRYGRFSIFKMAAAAILFFFGNFKFLTVGTLKRVHLRLHAKFYRNSSNQGWHMAIFRFFKMAAVRHLGISKVANFNFRSHSEAQYASPYQISQRSVEPFRRYGRFSIFKMAAAAILFFWKFQIFNGWDAQDGRTASACQILSKSLKSGLTYSDF